MAQLTVDDEHSGKLEQGQVVLALRLPPNEQATEAVEPGVGHFHHPPPGRVTVRMARERQRVSGAGLGWDVGRVAMGAGGLATGVIILAPIQTQLRALLIRLPCRPVGVGAQAHGGGLGAQEA